MSIFNDYGEEIRPEDFNLIMGIAGPLYQESKQVESLMQDNVLVNARPNDGSFKVMKGLEDIKNNIVQAPPRPQWTPPQPPVPSIAYEPITTTYQGINATVPVPKVAPEPTDQLEFNFNRSEISRLCDIMEKTTKQLTKLLSLLESNNEQQPIKLKK